MDSSDMAPNERTWPSYEEAKVLVQARGISSRKNYWEWVIGRRVQFVPRRPHDVYKRTGEWQGWVDYLGTTNTFDKTSKVVYLPFYEAAREVHKLGIQSIRDWGQYVKVNELPEGVPANPQWVYRDIWNKGVAWTEWLGKGLVVKLDTLAAIEHVWCFVHRPGMPSNVMSVRKCTKTEAKKGQADGSYQLLRVFAYESEYEAQMWDTLRSLSSDYEWVESDRLCNNYMYVLSQLASFLLVETL